MTYSNMGRTRLPALVTAVALLVPLGSYAGGESVVPPPAPGSEAWFTAECSGKSGSGLARCMRKKERKARKLLAGTMHSELVLLRAKSFDQTITSASFETAVDQLAEKYAPWSLAAPELSLASGTLSKPCDTVEHYRTPWRMPDLYGRTYFICIDGQNGLRNLGYPKHQFVHALPNQSLEIRLQTIQDVRYSVTADGETGIHQAGISSGGAEIAGVRSVDGSVIGTGDTARFVFPPHLPGKVDVRIVAEPAILLDVESLQDELDAFAGKVNTAYNGADREEDVKAAIKAIESVVKKGWADTEPNRTLVAEMAEKLKDLDVTPPTEGAITTALLRSLEDIQTKLKALEPSEQVLTFPVHVDETYRGNLSLGLAVNTLGAVDGHYTVGTPADAPEDTTTRTVQSAGNGYVDAELLLGYRHFFAPRPSSTRTHRVAAYGAMGLLGTDMTNLQVTALRSFHLGLEWGSEDWAIGIGPVVRNTTRLRDGFSVGQPVNKTAQVGSNNDGTVTNVTEDAWRIGISVVVFAPALFEYETKYKGSATTPAPEPEDAQADDASTDGGAQ